jgi:nucleoside-diphosphate kinase
MASRVHETAIFAFPIDQVWNVIRPVDFSFWMNVVNCKEDSEGIRTVAFADKTVQKFRVSEISEQNHQITFDLIESVPAVEYLSASHTWKLRRVTSDGTTFFEADSVYSKDATTNATEDSKYRKLDLFKELRAALAKGAGKKIVPTSSVSKTVSKSDEGKTCPPHGVPGSRMERSFIAVKPDGVQRGLVGEIMGRFEKRGFKLVAMKLVKPDKAFAAQHYADLKKKPFFGGLVDFFSSGPVCAMVWEGKNVIATGRAMLGATDPNASAPGTIRGDFGIEVGRNICHGSDSPKGAEAEINLWFRPEEFVCWSSTCESWIYE